MFLATKQVRRGKVLSARKNLQEQLKRRRSFERRLTPQIQKWFSFTAREAVDLLESSRPIELTKSRNELSKILSSHYQAVIKSFGDNFHYIKRKQEDKFDLYYRQYMVEFGGQKITNMTRTQQQRIIAVIDRSEFTGVADIGKQIREANKPTMTKARSVLIARTETHSASNYSNHQVAKEVGIPMKKRWVATNDDRTRSHHSSISGTEVGMDEDFEIVVNGIPYKMAYAGDPRGGAVNTINCRCVVMYVEPEDVVVDTTEPITETPAKPKVPVPPKPANDILASTINKSLTASSIKVLPRKESLKILNDNLKEASQDNRYLNKLHGTYRGVTKDDYGRIKDKLGGRELNDKTLSTLVALLPEMKDLCDKFNVPYLRGLKTSNNTTEFLANMGDGVMGLQRMYFNNQTFNVGEPKAKLSKRRIAQIESQIEQVEETIKRKQKVLEDILEEFGSFEKMDVANRIDYDSANRAIATLNLKRKDLKFRLKENDASKLTDTSTWKRGDYKLDRPHNGSDFFDNDFDRLRQTWYHEIGHHIHQMYKTRFRTEKEMSLVRKKYSSSTVPAIAEGGEAQYYLQIFKPLEERLYGGINYKYRAVSKNKNSKIDLDESSTTYGTTNPVEWFAENFALYYLDKKDLVDPAFVQILKDIIDDKIF